MKFFICALDKINIAIPSERTERIIPVTRIQTAIYEVNSENETQMAYISLPLLFRQNSFLPAQPEGQHGLILKPADAGKKQKTVLLTPRVDIEIEIPEEKIQKLPEALDDMLRYFMGAHFNGENLILILNTKKLTEAYCD